MKFYKTNIPHFIETDETFRSDVWASVNCDGNYLPHESRIFYSYGEEGSDHVNLPRDTAAGTLIEAVKRRKDIILVFPLFLCLLNHREARWMTEKFLQVCANVTRRER